MYDHDEDFQDPAQRCEHGTFIGSWWGPDYLCGLCEDGISRAQQLRQSVAGSRRQLTAQKAAVVELWVGMTHMNNAFTNLMHAPEVDAWLKYVNGRFMAARAEHRELVARAWADTRPVRA